MAGIQIDEVNNKIDFDDDADTSISSASDDTLVVEVGGNTLATVTATSVTVNDGVEITTADNTDTLTLTSTDADANAGPNLLLDRNSASTANQDALGAITFRGRNDAAQNVDYIKLEAVIADETDGTEDGNFHISNITAGTARKYISVNRADVTLNEDSQDIDFRVETNGNEHGLFVDAGNDLVMIGGVGSTSAVTDPRIVLFDFGQINIFRAANSNVFAVIFNNTDTSAAIGSIRMNGSATTFNTSSDYRLKENVNYDWDATTRLKQLKPARFNWIADDTNTALEGFLAHEVTNVVPEAISGDKDQVATSEDVTAGLAGAVGDPIYQGIDQSKLVPLMVKTIQELEARIATLEGN